MRKPVSIYLIDDHKVFAQAFASFILSQEGFIWKGYGSGDKSTIADIIRLRPDVVLLDFHLQYLNGLDVLLMLNQSGWKGYIVMLTMSRDQLVKNAVKASGAKGFVNKECDGNELLLGLQELVEGKTAFLDLVSPTNEKIRGSYGLTNQERSIAELVCAGLDSDHIAYQLNISVHTVNTHRRRILAKTNSQNFLQVCVKLKG